MGLYDRVMGNTWVYDRIRPFVLGGLDYTETYHWLQTTRDDVLLDIGCGTGHALDTIKEFKSYHGFDIDDRALTMHKKKHTSPAITLYRELLTAKHVEIIKPTKCIMVGLLHHLRDSEALTLFENINAAKTIERIITLDTTYLKGRWINNFFAWCDRGRHVRTEAEYRALIAKSPYAVSNEKYIDTGNRASSYFATCLTMRNAQVP